MSDTHQPLVYADCVHVLSEYIFTVEKVTEVLLVASKEGFFYSRVSIFSSVLRFHLIYRHTLCDLEINNNNNNKPESLINPTRTTAS